MHDGEPYEKFIRVFHDADHSDKNDESQGEKGPVSVRINVWMTILVQFHHAQHSYDIHKTGICKKEKGKTG